MNVEFQIHGVLPSGQKTWKKEDQDYYKQFYIDQTEDVLMIVEIVNRPHGVSTYYNYLRNNNILSARVGSYFGMTMRIDGAFCRDVKSIFMILDNLFNKMMVGSLLVPKEDKYEYVIDSFAAKNDYLLQVEKHFSDMLNAFCSPQDFFEISSACTSQGMKQSVNASEITIPMAVETIKQRAKLYLSPTYQSKAAQKKIADAKAEADAAVTDANARIQAAEDAHSKSRKQEQEYKSWKKEKEALEEARDAAIQDYQELERKVRKAELNTSINAKISEIKQPLIQLAGLMAERFQEDSYGNVQEKPQPHKKERKEDKLLVWLPWAICILLGIALAGTIWYMDGNKNTEQSRNMSDHVKTSELRSGTEDFRNLCIDIKGLVADADSLTSGVTYTCEITGGQYPRDGHWVICDGDKIINGNEFKVSSPSGTHVKITYYKGTEVIKEKDIAVK